jgi:protein translocase SecG subunit
MSFLEGIWFTLAILIIAIILIVDPKNNVSGLSNNPLLGSFSSPSSKQNFVYNLAAIFIASFFLLTLTISYNS